MHGLVLQSSLITQVIGLAGNLHNTVLQISEATILPYIVEISQNLTKLLHFT